MKKTVLLIGLLLTAATAMQAQTEIVPFPRQFRPANIVIELPPDEEYPEDVSKGKIEYNYTDNVTQITSYDWQNNDWVLESEMIEQEFDNGGNVVREGHYEYVNNQWVGGEGPRFRYDYRYGNDEKLLSYTSYIYEEGEDEIDWGEVAYEYNAEGLVERMECMIRHIESPDYYMQYTRHFTYDAGGNLLAEKRYMYFDETEDEEGDIFQLYEYTYEEGLLAFMQVYRGAENVPGMDDVIEPAMYITFNYPDTRIDTPAVANVSVYAGRDGISIRTDEADTVSVYTIDGKLLAGKQILPRLNHIPIARMPAGVLIVKGSKGWARKTVISNQ